PITEPRNGTNRRPNSLGPKTAIDALAASRNPTGAPWFQSSGSKSWAGVRSIRFRASIDSSIHKHRSFIIAPARSPAPTRTRATSRVAGLGRRGRVGGVAGAATMSGGARRTLGGESPSRRLARGGPSVALVKLAPREGRANRATSPWAQTGGEGNTAPRAGSTASRTR